MKNPKLMSYERIKIIILIRNKIAQKLGWEIPIVTRHKRSADLTNYNPMFC